MEKFQNIYDNEQFFNSYKEMRDGKLNANELIEIPTMKSLLPELKGKNVLDLGCGEGEMSRHFLSLGAKRVVGLDISQNMLNEAKKFKTENLELKLMPMEEISSIEEEFDVVFSSLAFHYVEDFYKLMKDIASKLRSGGCLLFSQEHPLVTAMVRTKDMPKYIEKDNRRYYIVTDYNNIGKRFVDWNVEGVVKYHRNFETIFKALKEAGFELEDIVEAKAPEEAIKKVEKYKFLNDRPYFLFIKARKV